MSSEKTATEKSKKYENAGRNWWTPWCEQRNIQCFNCRRGYPGPHASRSKLDSRHRNGAQNLCWFARFRGRAGHLAKHHVPAGTHPRNPTRSNRANATKERPCVEPIGRLSPVQMPDRAAILLVTMVMQRSMMASFVARRAVREGEKTSICTSDAFPLGRHPFLPQRFSLPQPTLGVKLRSYAIVDAVKGTKVRAECGTGVPPAPQASEKGTGTVASDAVPRGQPV